MKEITSKTEEIKRITKTTLLNLIQIYFKR